MYQIKLFQMLRALGRKVGLNKLFAKIYNQKEYEANFEKALLSLVKETDIIYDIGANRGFYTKLFLLKAAAGKVFAIEPVPENYKLISELSGSYNNLKLYSLALGSEPGSLPMSVGSDNLNATSKIKSEQSASDILVNVETLDNIVAENKTAPNVIKIDVEGFELEVLKGMTATLKNNSVSVIAIEVHFTLLAQSRIDNAPKQIVNILKKNNFRVKWVDPSHIIATRGRN